MCCGGLVSGAVGQVDDEAFVGAYVRDRIAHRPMGVRRMVQDLYAKGISREVSAPVIEDVLRDEDTDERTLAEQVVEKKRRTLASRSQNEAVLRRRLRDHLIRRGFDTRVVSEVVDELFSGDATNPRPNSVIRSRVSPRSVNPRMGFWNGSISNNLLGTCAGAPG